MSDIGGMTGSSSHDLLTRPYQPDDAVVVASLANLIMYSAGGDLGLPAEELAFVVATLVRDTGTDSRLLFEPGGGLVAFGMVTTPPAGGHQLDLLGGVHPRWRGREIGRDVLGWQLTRAAEIHQLRAPAASWEAHVGIVLGEEDAARLLPRFGFAPVRYWIEMLASTADPPTVALPDGVRTATYSSEYERALHAANMEAFADHWGHQPRGLDEWVPRVRSEPFAPELSVVAFDGDELVGYVLSYHDANPSRLSVKSVGVRPPWRRRGLASALLSWVLQTAAKASLTDVALGVDADNASGAVALYERSGFQVRHRAVTYSVAFGPSGPSHP